MQWHYPPLWACLVPGYQFLLRDTYMHVPAKLQGCCLQNSRSRGYTYLPTYDKVPIVRQKPQRVGARVGTSGIKGTTMPSSLLLPFLSAVLKPL